MFFNKRFQTVHPTQQSINGSFRWSHRLLVQHYVSEGIKRFHHEQVVIHDRTLGKIAY